VQHPVEPGDVGIQLGLPVVALDLGGERVPAEAEVLDERAADGVLAPAAGAEAMLIERELERALESALTELDGDAAAAIAGLLGRSQTPDVKPATLRKRLSRAYAKLRLLLGGADVG
jgi:DNA-directed RNA polymerase specialized sigma24 family protein